MNYKDPAFSVLLFLVIVLVVIVISNFLGKLKEQKKVFDLKKFINSFEFSNSDEISEVINKSNVDSILLLALSFEKSGSYEKALNIYLAVLNVIKNRYDILKNVANLYIKVGFLQKAKESLYTILKNTPRDREALKMLLFVDDKLQNYSEISEILEILENLGENVEAERAYLNMQLYKKNLIMKIEDLIILYKKYPILKRFYFEELLKIDYNKALNEIEESDVYKMVDILWNLDLPNKNSTFCNLLSAKHKMSCSTIAPFEIEVLKNLKKDIAILDFEYICEECKNIFPIYEYRCPKCKSLFSFNVEMKLEAKNREKLPETF